MRQLQLEQIGEAAFLSYTLEETECCDALALGMMENNDISGLLPVHRIQVDQQQTLRYSVSGLSPAAEALAGLKDGRKLILLLKGIADTVSLIGKYMIDETSLLLDPAYIFVDGDFCGTLVCLPVLPGENGTLRDFCRELLEDPQVKPLVENEYSAIAGFLDQEPFKAQAFSDFLADLELRGAICIPGKETEAARVLRHQHVVLQRPAADASPQGDAHSGGSQVRMEEDGGVIVLRRGKDSGGYNSTVFVSAAGQSEETAMVPEDPGEDSTIYIAQAEPLHGILVRAKTQERVKIDKDEFRIGKSPRDADYCMYDNPSVSRHHAKIVRKEDGFFLIDEDSKNHTFVNHRMIEPGISVPLEDQTQIRMANEDFLFLLE